MNSHTGVTSVHSFEADLQLTVDANIKSDLSPESNKTCQHMLSLEDLERLIQEEDDELKRR